MQNLTSFHRKASIVVILCSCFRPTDLTWHYELQAESNTIPPLLNQFPGLTLPTAHLQSARQAEIARIAVYIAHNRLFPSIFNTRAILCNANKFVLWCHVRLRHFPNFCRNYYNKETTKFFWTAQAANIVSACHSPFNMLILALCTFVFRL